MVPFLLQFVLKPSLVFAWIFVPLRLQRKYLRKIIQIMWRYLYKSSQYFYKVAKCSVLQVMPPLGSFKSAYNVNGGNVEVTWYILFFVAWNGKECGEPEWGKNTKGTKEVRNGGEGYRWKRHFALSFSVNFALVL